MISLGVGRADSIPRSIKDFLPTSYNTLSILIKRIKRYKMLRKNRIVYFSLKRKSFIGIVFLSIRNILETILGKYFNSNLICWVLQFMRTINWNRAVINGGVANEPKSNLDVWRSWIQQWSNINFQDYLQSSHLRFRAIWESFQRWKLDPVGSTVRFEVMKLFTGSE